MQAAEMLRQRGKEAVILYKPGIEFWMNHWLNRFIGYNFSCSKAMIHIKNIQQVRLLTILNFN